MFKYVSDISDLSHSIIENHLEKRVVAIDATLGNGYDTDFLCERFEKVYSFDVQEEACLNYKLKNRKNVSVVNDSHHKFDEYVIEDKVNCIMYNLGFLPGSNKEITTLAKTTMKSIEAGLELLVSNGIMTIAMSKEPMSRKSAAAIRRVSPLTADSPNPIQKESSRAVMMSRGAGISTVK